MSRWRLPIDALAIYSTRISTPVSSFLCSTLPLHSHPSFPLHTLIDFPTPFSSSFCFSSIRFSYPHSSLGRLVSTCVARIGLPTALSSSFRSTLCDQLPHSALYLPFLHTAALILSPTSLSFSFSSILALPSSCITHYTPQIQDNKYYHQ